MLATLRQCPESREITLDLGFKKDVNWFINYLGGTNGVFIIDQDHRSPKHVYVDACTTGCGAICQAEAYHSEFQASILQANHPICELEAINAMVALKCWTPQLTAQNVVLHSDSATVLVIFQAGRGHNTVIQPCVREIWCVCAINDINLNVRFSRCAQPVPPGRSFQSVSEKPQEPRHSHNITLP